MTVRLQGTPRQGLWGATLGFFIGFAAVALFGPTATRFQEAMELTPMMVGLLIAMPALSGSLLRIPFAAWVDISGGRKPFLVLLGLSIVGMAGLLAVVWLAYPHHMSPSLYPLLLALGLLCGCGIATFSVGAGQVSYWHPLSRQGTALGIYAGVSNLAPGLFSFLLPVLLAWWGLGGAYLAWLVFLVAGTALYAKLGRNSYYFQFISAGSSREEAKVQARELGQELFPARSLVESLATSARSWKTWLLVGVYFVTFGGFIGLTAWLPLYWMGAFSFSAMAAGSLTAAYSIFSSLSRVAGGAVADRAGGEASAFAGLGVMLIGTIWLIAAPPWGAAVAATMLMGLGMGVANAAVFKLVPRAAPEAVGGVSGWVGGLGAFGGFVIPPLLGWFVSAFGPAGYSRGFLVFFGLAAAAAGCIVVLTLAHRAALRAAQQAGPAVQLQYEAEQA